MQLKMLHVNIVYCDKYALKQTNVFRLNLLLL